MERNAIHVHQIKANSKKEMVRILHLEGDVYMSPLSQNKSQLHGRSSLWRKESNHFHQFLACEVKQA